MGTFLLAWNPAKFAWDEVHPPSRRLRAMAARSRAGFRVRDSWSVARSKQIHEGDRLFLIRLGRQPRGIIGSGYATSDWYPGRDWLESRDSPVVHYVDLEFDALLHPDRGKILSVSDLRDGALRQVHWSTQSSGIRIPEDAAQELERRWHAHLAQQHVAPVPVRRGGGGFGDAENNRRVEEAAIRFVIGQLTRAGWKLEDPRRYGGFDLLFRRGSRERHVEVKGVGGPEQRFIITAGEVHQAEDDPHFELWVVTDALSRRWRAAHRYFGRGFLQAFSLEPVQYKARRNR